MKDHGSSIQLVSIILPTYNEADNIIPLIKAIDGEVLYEKEIRVIDDNSPDGTSAKVRRYIRESGKSYIHCETRYEGRGLTNSISRGIALSRGDVVVWMDCDFSMPPSVIPKLLEKIREGFDVAVGSRFAPGGKTKQKSPRDSLLGIALSSILNILMRPLLGSGFYDYTSGFIAVRKKVLASVSLRGDYGEYFIDFIARVFARGYRVAEVPYVCEPRRAGVSKTGQNIVDYVLRGRKYVLTVVRLLMEKHVFHTLS